jgi:hypothetical protein
MSFPLGHFKAYWRATPKALREHHPRGGMVDEERSMKRRVTSALIAGAITAVSGIVFYYEFPARSNG